MSRERLADAFDNAAEALAQLALELRGTEPEVARASVPERPAADPVEGAKAPQLSSTGSESAFTQCPAHKVAWMNGKFGPFCPAQSDDFPDWANDKGYCRVTPKNAGAWLAKHPKGVAA
jgi:hypothetical protein